MTDARHWWFAGLCKVLVSWDIRNLYSLFKTEITKSYHKDQETIMRIISQDITKSFEESRGLWSSRISTLHGTRTVGCQWAQTVAQLGDTDSGWYLDSTIYLYIFHRETNTIEGIYGVDYYPGYHPKHYHHFPYEYWVWLTDCKALLLAPQKERIIFQAPCEPPDCPPQLAMKKRLTLRLVKQDTGYTPRLQLPFRFRSTIESKTNLIDMVVR